VREGAGASCPTPDLCGNLGCAWPERPPNCRCAIVEPHDGSTPVHFAVDRDTPGALEEEAVDLGKRVDAYLQGAEDAGAVRTALWAFEPEPGMAQKQRDRLEAERAHWREVAERRHAVVLTLEYDLEVARTEHRNLEAAGEQGIDLAQAATAHWRDRAEAAAREVEHLGDDLEAERRAGARLQAELERLEGALQAERRTVARLERALRASRVSQSRLLQRAQDAETGLEAALEREQGRLRLRTPTEHALARIADERARQEQMKAAGRFDYTCADAEMTHSERFVVLGEEVGEVAREVLEGAFRDVEPPEALRAELTHVAAVCAAWIEALT
jgi:hypothetical protein